METIDMPTIAAKLIIEVHAGILSGTPVKEFSKRWVFSSEEWDAVQAGDEDAKMAWITKVGASREYAATLEDPSKANWVRRDWLWL